MVRRHRASRLLRRSGLRLAAVALAVLDVGSAAQAASDPTPVLQPSDALSCLSPAAAERGEPEYPFAAYKKGQAGRVKVSVTYPGGLFGPRIQVLDQEGDATFVEAVERFVGKLKVPCLPEGRSATLVFDYIFEPTEPKPFSSEPVDAADARRERLMSCMTRPEGRPRYPYEARRQNLSGRIVALLRFDAADQPPRVQLFHPPRTRMLAAEVGYWLRDVRLPCLEGEPLAMSLVFFFLLENDAYGFKPMSLVQLLPLVKGIRTQTLQLDTTTMGCPFSLRWHYRRPYLHNVVSEIGAPDPRRRPLRSWLQDAELELSQIAADSAFADSADITVPCMKIDLKKP